MKTTPWKFNYHNERLSIVTNSDIELVSLDASAFPILLSYNSDFVTGPIIEEEKPAKKVLKEIDMYTYGGKFSDEQLFEHFKSDKPLKTLKNILKCSTGAASEIRSGKYRIRNFIKHLFNDPIAKESSEDYLLKSLTDYLKFVNDEKESFSEKELLFYKVEVGSLTQAYVDIESARDKYTKKR